MQAEDSICQNQPTTSQRQMTSRKWGITQLCPPLKASKVKIQDPLGAEFITQDLSCNAWEARILMVLDPLNGSVPSKLGPGGPFWSWRPPMAPMDCGVRSADLRTPKTKKRPKKAKEPNTTIFTQDPKKSQKAIESKIIKISLSKGQGPKAMVRPGGISKANGDKTP
ncbi:hypothetical protein O181_117228 [Austropuccinia psidii MF-1]|uniref:Uncharacterized protein n=1 Tax=Austropuccinia psidii MF-1 TaxID=1389203 RepID=A0A9Q3K9S4_9BASI|nr:hypothetical protein [Austropuccinia psidii MF-1]